MRHALKIFHALENPRKFLILHLSRCATEELTKRGAPINEQLAPISGCTSLLNDLPNEGFMRRSIIRSLSSLDDVVREPLSSCYPLCVESLNPLCRDFVPGVSEQHAKYESERESCRSADIGVGRVYLRTHVCSGGFFETTKTCPG